MFCWLDADETPQASPVLKLHEACNHGVQGVVAAAPDVFAWYIKTYGPEVNLFVDHSQILQLESLRSGLWGTKDVWGRILTYKG